MSDKQKKMSFAVVEQPSGTVSIPALDETVNAKGYVNYGRDNQFPQFLDSLYRNSATLRSIIDGSVRYIVGNGVVAGDDASKWSGSVNRKADTLDEICEAAGLDYLKYGGFAIQVIYSHLGTIAEIYALPFEKVRISEDGTRVFYATKWGGYTTRYKEYGTATDRDSFSVYSYKPEASFRVNSSGEVQELLDYNDVRERLEYNDSTFSVYCNEGTFQFKAPCSACRVYDDSTQVNTITFVARPLVDGDEYLGKWQVTNSSDLTLVSWTAV